MRHEYDQRDYYDDEEEGLDLVDLIFATIRRWKLITLIAIPIIAAGIFLQLQDLQYIELMLQ